MNTRRGFLTACGFGVSSLAFAGTTGKGKTVRIADFDATGKRTGVEEVEKVVKTDDEWRKQLSPEQFEVTQQSRHRARRHRQVRRNA